MVIFDVYLKLSCPLCGGFFHCFCALHPYSVPSPQRNVSVYYLVTSGLLNVKSSYFWIILKGKKILSSSHL